MKKGLLKTLTVAALTLAGVSPIYAFAPVIQALPDVVVGDAEDNVGTVDSNFFRYNNAINFLNYVSDADTTSTAIRWSFMEADTTSTININGKGQLAGAEVPTAPPVGKELTAAGTTFWANFRITKYSPGTSTGPFTITPAPTSGTIFFNRLVTLFATDGSAADSKTITVYAVENGFDRLSAAAAIYTEGFNSGLDGWTSFAPAGTIPLTNGASFQATTNAYDSGHGGAAGLTTPAGATGSAGFYGWYQSPAAIPYVSGKVYRARWAVTTNQATAANVPTARMRLTGNAVVANASILQVNPGGANLNVPTPSGDTTYAQYWQPANLSSLQSNSTSAGLAAYFELENFGGASVSGALYLDSLTIDLVDRPTQTADLTVTTFNNSGTPSFSYISGTLPLAPGWLAPTTSGINTSAFSMGITAGAATATDVGLLSGSGFGTVPAVAGNLYRATATIHRGGSDAVATFPAMRVRLNAGSGEVGSENDIFNGGAGIAIPATGAGTDYDVYLVGPAFSTATQPYVYPSFDLYSASTAESGTATLTSIITSHGAQP